MNDREDLADQTYGQYSYNELPIDTLVKCNDNTHWGKSYFVYGFSDIEPDGRWSIGDESLIRFKNGESDQKHSLEVDSEYITGSLTSLSTFTSTVV